MKVIISGNEAIARGFYEAGGRLAAAYPGTPSTEALEALCAYEGIHAEWSANEKVALEVAIGGSLAGVRSMACMKHVGVNVAADPLMTASYTGVNAGLVVFAADDPGMFSSQNEQDTRHYARLAKIPCIEPSDSQEAKDFVRAALELSERFDTPVLLRTTTRVSHCKSVVELGVPVKYGNRGLEKKPAKYVMLPANARRRHSLVEKRMLGLKSWAEDTPLNISRDKGAELGVITNGISYQYVLEAFPEASVLRLGVTWPLPERKIRRFAARVKRLAVVEELDPFMEGEIRAMGIEVHYGKGALPMCGEYGKGMLLKMPGGEAMEPSEPVKGLAGRSPTLCPGCPHRGLFVVLSKLKAFVSGDIGCYTLGGLPPFSALHTCICMGASIPAAHGINKGLELSGKKKKPFAVIGDSTFIHSGITGLANMVYNGGEAVVIIMNNDTTGMTGGQGHPGSGMTARGEAAPKLDILKLCQALGATRVREIDAYNLKELERTLKQEAGADGISVLVSNQPCVLKRRPLGKPLKVNRGKCTACRKCLKAGCIALTLVEEGGAGYAEIDPLLCGGCAVCMQLCGSGGIEKAEP